MITGPVSQPVAAATVRPAYLHSVPKGRGAGYTAAGERGRPATRNTENMNRAVRGIAGRARRAHRYEEEQWPRRECW